MAAYQVRALLMGGQACVFYGAAESSRDTDLLALADAGNLQRLDRALRELHAECIAVLPCAVDHIERGHEVAQAAPQIARALEPKHSLLRLAETDRLRESQEALADEAHTERERDRTCWQPLTVASEKLRQAAEKAQLPKVRAPRLDLAIQLPPRMLRS